MKLQQGLLTDNEKGLFDDPPPKRKGNSRRSRALLVAFLLGLLVLPSSRQWIRETAGSFGVTKLYASWQLGHRKDLLTALDQGNYQALRTKDPFHDVLRGRSMDAIITQWNKEFATLPESRLTLYGICVALGLTDAKKALEGVDHSSVARLQGFERSLEAQELPAEYYPGLPTIRLQVELYAMLISNRKGVDQSLVAALNNPNPLVVARASRATSLDHKDVERALQRVIATSPYCSFAAARARRMGLENIPAPDLSSPLYDPRFEYVRGR